MMLLSDFQGTFFDVIREGEFDTLGNVTSAPDGPCLTYVLNERYFKIAQNNSIFSCVICPRGLGTDPSFTAAGMGIAVADDPKSAFQLFHNWLIVQNTGYAAALPGSETGIGCLIDPGAQIAPKGVKIGNNVTIERNAIIHPGVCIEDNVVISAGAVVGAECTLVGKTVNGDLFRIRSAGGVRIRRNAFLANYAYVGRGLFPYESTVVGENSCVGYAVEVSHNCEIGSNCVILDQAQICGNTVLEDGVRISPRAIVSNRLRIGKNAVVDIGSVVVGNVWKGARVAGNFAIEHEKFLLWHKNKLRSKHLTVGRG